MSKEAVLWDDLSGIFLSKAGRDMGSRNILAPYAVEMVSTFLDQGPETVKVHTTVTRPARVGTKHMKAPISAPISSYIYISINTVRYIT